MPQFDLNNPRTLATTAIMTALVLALTSLARIPTAAGGYVHLGDVAIFFTALAFGPWAGLVAGGLGTGLADLLGGWGHFAPLSLIVHGLQGFAVGLIYYRLRNPFGVTLSLLAGSVIVVGGYFLGEYAFEIWGGPAAAVAEVVPNIGQVLVGSLGGWVYLSVVQVYPRLKQNNQQQA